MATLVAADPVIDVGSAGQGERERLKGAAVSGVAANLGAQLALFALRLGYQVAIARLLLPGDFGLVAMITPVIAFVQLFADLGLSQATIQMKEISQAQLSSLFWLNVTAGLVLSGVCVACAPLVAAFYGDPRASGIMVASAVMFALGGFFNQHLAVLNRQMRFRAIAGINIVTFLVGSASGIGSALLGAGYWAIVINQFGNSVASLGLALSVCRWLPGRPASLAQSMPLLKFGSNLTGFNIVNFFSRNSANILLGRFAGEQPLGLYDRATKLMLMPFFQIVAPFSSVAMPLLSRTQDQPELYRRAYGRMLETVLLLIYPCLVFMVVNSHTLTIMALGQPWAGVAPVFAILGVDMFVAPIGSSMGWLFISQGRTREMRNWGMVTSVLFMALFAAGLPWGPQGVAAGYASAGLVEIVLLVRAVARSGPVRARDILALLAPFLFAAAVALAVVWGLKQSGLPPLIGLALGGAGSYASFALALLALPRGRRVLREAFEQASGLAAKALRR